MSDKAPDLVWHDAVEIGCEGQPWPDTEGPFGRLPLRVKDRVRERLWECGCQGAGLCVHFETDAPRLWARWRLPDEAQAVYSQTGLLRAGLDLYGRDAERRWRWAGIGLPFIRPVALDELGRNRFDAERRRWRLYLPIHERCTELAVGVPRGSLFEPVPPRPDRPVVFYGTSIVHGLSATRPGMNHPAILGRRLDVPVVNLGLAGEGRMDPPIVELLGEIHARVFVVDCLPNMGTEEVAERAEPAVLTLREAQPDVPIVLVEDRTWAAAWTNAELRRQHDQRRAALRTAFENLEAHGIQDLYYVEGADLLGNDGDGTVDASHPSDLGFARMADVLEPILRPLL